MKETGSSAYKSATEARISSTNITRFLTHEDASMPTAQILRELAVRVAAGDGAVNTSKQQLAICGLPEPWVRGELHARLADLPIITDVRGGMGGVLEHGHKVIVTIADRSPSSSGVFIP